MSDLDTLHQAIDSLALAEQNAKQTHYEVLRNERKSHTILHWMFLVIGGFALLNLYYVNDLSQEVKTIIRHMNQMYMQFGEMSERMKGMSRHVVNMDSNIALVPVMGEQMDMMEQRMGTMQKSVGEMHQSVGNMQGRVASMNRDVGSMSQSFYTVNRRVGQIQRNVGQMADVLP